MCARRRETKIKYFFKSADYVIRKFEKKSLLVISQEGENKKLKAGPSAASLESFLRFFSTFNVLEMFQIFP